MSFILSNLINLGGNVTGTLSVSNGGTGAATLAANDVLLGNGTSALQTVAPGTSGNILTSNGTTWLSQANAALTNPMTTLGDMIYENSTPAPARLAIGTAGQILTVSSGIPTWSSSVSALTTFSSGITFGGSTLSTYAQNSTWTPVMQFGGTNGTGSYGFQYGYYTQIGNVVHFVLTVDYTTHNPNTDSGNLGITLPLTSKNINSNYETSVSLGRIYNNSGSDPFSSVQQFGALISNNSAVVTPIIFNTNGNNSNLPASAFGTSITWQFSISGIYLV